MYVLRTGGHEERFNLDPSSCMYSVWTTWKRYLQARAKRGRFGLKNEKATAVAALKRLHLSQSRKAATWRPILGPLGLHPGRLHLVD